MHPLRMYFLSFYLLLLFSIHTIKVDKAVQTEEEEIPSALYALDSNGGIQPMLNVTTSVENEAPIDEQIVEIKDEDENLNETKEPKEDIPLVPKNLNHSFSHTINDYDFGENVFIFNDTSKISEIQQITTEIYEKQETNDFGPERYAYFFLPKLQNGKLLPNSYNISNLYVGFHMQVLGLGMKPNDVIIEGHISSIAAKGRWHVLSNFWRSVENLQINNKGNISMDINETMMVWGSSQASPMRRLYVKGDLYLSLGKWWSSGGWLSDSVIEGNIYSSTQQQFITRSSSWKTWEGCNWNMVFLGSQGIHNNASVASDREFYSLAHAISISRVPEIRQKPFLALDPSGDVVVVKPSFAYHPTPGPSWEDPEQEKISLRDFYIAKPIAGSKDYVSQLQTAMQKDGKKHILFTPGIYEFEKPLKIYQKGSVILGIGLPTLLPLNGASILEVDDNADITISGLLFESGPRDSEVLVRIGTHVTKTKNEHPIVLHDIFIRIGPNYNSFVDTAIEINSNNVIIDHIWIWRADHEIAGTFRQWNRCEANHGMEINGNDVVIYGLFVEHFLKEQTVWNGENGILYFYQSEIPYFVPTPWGRKEDSIGYPSYKVNEKVTKHHAIGLGIYTVFFKDDVMMTNLIESPETEEITLQNLVGVLIKPGPSPGVGGVKYMLNQRFRMGRTPEDGVNIYSFKGLNCKRMVGRMKHRSLQAIEVAEENAYAKELKEE